MKRVRNKIYISSCNRHKVKFCYWRQFLAGRLLCQDGKLNPKASVWSFYTRMIRMSENTDSHSQQFSRHSRWPWHTSGKWENGEPAKVARWPWQRGIITASKTLTVYSLWSGKRRAFIWAVTIQKPRTSEQRPWTSRRRHAAHSVSSESENHSNDSHQCISAPLAWLLTLILQ